MSNTFNLVIPFTTAAGTQVTQLNLRRVSVKDLKAARKVSNNPADWDDILISRSTGIPPEDFDNMDLEDYLALQQRFQEITGVGKKPKNDDASTGAAGPVVPLPAE